MIPKLFENLGFLKSDGSGSVFSASIGQSISTEPDGPDAMTPPLLANNTFVNSHILNGHSGNVESVSFSPSGQRLASASCDGSIRMWDAISGSHIETLNCQRELIFSAAFSPDGTLLASGSSKHTITIWDLGSWAQIATLKGHGDTIKSVAFSPNGRILASGSTDITTRLWDVKSKTCIGILRGHLGGVSSVAFSPNGKRVASGSYDNTIQLWNVKKGTSTATLSGHSKLVLSVAFSPSGKHLASGSVDRTVQLWSADSGAPTATMHGHSHEVHSVTFSPDSQYLASGSYDRTIRLWDIASTSCISILEDHRHCVTSVRFSPDGTRLASGSYDKTVRIWTISPEEASIPVVTRFTPDSIGLTERIADDPQDTTTTASIPVLPNNDTTESTSLTDTTLSSQGDITAPLPISFPLKRDITESVSLEGSRPIGYGGFGELFLGVHRDQGKVALKKPRRLPDEELIRRFLREVDLWCSVTHPHVLPCLGMCRVGLDVYVVSPFIENGDLSSCIARGKELNRSKLLFEVAEALTHLHHRGIVHGDVKAQNVLLADDGSALLCDFGLAKAFDKMVTSTGSVGVGSVRWMAPELFLGEGRSMASDVYSLGITIAEVLSGRAPYEDMSESLAVMFHVVHSEGRPPKEPLVSPEGKSYTTLWETAEKCWVKDAKARPHMAQVLGMLFPITRDIA